SAVRTSPVNDGLTSVTIGTTRTSGSQMSGTPLLFRSVTVPAAISHASGTPLLLQSGVVPAATSHASTTPLLLQSGSHTSRMPLEWQSLAPLASSQASRTLLPLQSVGLGGPLPAATQAGSLDSLAAVGPRVP